jgi:hypothetical protein
MSCAHLQSRGARHRPPASNARINDPSSISDAVRAMLGPVTDSSSSKLARH